MCDCITTVEGKLAEHNTRLSLAMMFGESKNPGLMLETEVVEKKRGARPIMMFCSYCPFCGEKYEETE